MDPIFCHKVWTVETCTVVSTQGWLFLSAAGRQSPALASVGCFSTCSLPKEQSKPEKTEARKSELLCGTR